MRALNYSILVIFFLTISIAGNAKEKFEKKFHEQYDVNKETLFEISNKYGTINIENVNDDLITIDAEIIVETGSQEKADRFFQSIEVKISKEGDVVKAITTIDNLKSYNTEFEINYKVSMPAYLNINLSNKYGSVIINELHGQSNLNVKYGSLNVNRITDDNQKPLSSIQLGYCERSKINEFNWGTLIVKYSKIEVEKGKALVISSKYSKLTIGDFSSLVCEAGYDDYFVGNVSNLIMDSKYSDLKIESIAKKFTLENKYGDVYVNKIPDGFSSINITSKYAKVNLGIDENASYNLQGQAKYCDINYGKIQIQERIKESNSLYIKGSVGEKETNSKILIETEYGNVNLN